MTKVKEPCLFWMGGAQTVLTPPVGTSLAGYFHDRISVRVRDDLYARVLIIVPPGEAPDPGKALLLCSCDLISMDTELVADSKALIRERTGIPPERILLCATHTHTGPEVRRVSVIPVNGSWLSEVPGLLAEAAEKASKSMARGTLHPGRAEVTGYAFNRLFRLKDGTEVFGKVRGGNQVIGPAGPIDPELQTLSCVREDGRVLAQCAHYALHADVIGGGTADFISSDWPGEMARTLSLVYGEEAVTLFLQGTAGDINHHAHEASFLPGGGPEKAIQIGRGVAGSVLLAAERAEPLTECRMEAVLETVDVPYYTRDDKLREEVKALKSKEEQTPFDRYLIQRWEEWPHDGETAHVPVQALRIGPLGIIALPAEVFVGIGLQIKAWSPCEFTWVVTLANGRVSTYVPTTEQAERGAYGARPILSRWLCSDAGRRLADASQVLLHRLFT